MAKQADSSDVNGGEWAALARLEVESERGQALADAGERYHADDLLDELA